MVVASDRAMLSGLTVVRKLYTCNRMSTTPCLEKSGGLNALDWLYSIHRSGSIL